MKYPKAKFKVGDKVEVDGFDKAVIVKKGLFRKLGKGKDSVVYWSYQLSGNILPGFWAKENRLTRSLDNTSGKEL